MRSRCCANIKTETDGAAIRRYKATSDRRFHMQAPLKAHKLELTYTLNSLLFTLSFPCITIKYNSRTKCTHPINKSIPFAFHQCRLTLTRRIALSWYEMVCGMSHASNSVRLQHFQPDPSLIRRSLTPFTKQQQRPS
jgi:hypothetical protein